MTMLAAIRRQGAFTMLAVVLALVFAAMSLSSVVDRIQHAPGGSTEHQHLLFSEYSADADADHHAPQPDDDSPGNHLGSGHHHHAEGMSGLLALAGGSATTMPLAGMAYNLENTAPPLGAYVPGPERPPRASDTLA